MSNTRLPIVLAIFVLSGAAGLIYEIVWSRQLVLVFGNTTQAVSAILAGFFGGLAIGAWVGGRLADRVGSPLRLYGLLEIILVGLVLITPLSFGLIQEVYRGVYPSLEGTPQVLAVVRLALAVLALSPATILMGATLPTLTRELAWDERLATAFGRLYAANTIGAIIGTLAAGLVLIELLGLSGALAVGASCSAIAGAIALLVSRRGRAIGSTPATPRPTDDEPSAAEAPQRGRTRLALLVAFVSGLTSLGYQVLWVRLLASGTGNTTYVFTIILAVFLIGLAIGALLNSSLRARITEPVRLLAATQVLVAVLVLLGLVGVVVRPEALPPAYSFESIVVLLGDTLVVVLPATVAMGLAFPLTSRLLPDDARRAGTESGSLLGVNTLGAILGSVLIPFVIIPAIGSPLAVAVMALLNLGLAVVLALRAERQATATLVVAAAAGIAVVGSMVVPGVLVQPNEAYITASGGTVFASTEDEIASVQAGQVRNTPELWVGGTSMTLLTVDAKLMPILPLIARPDSERALIVAFGMGSAHRAALIAGLETDAVELVPSVPDMFGWYYPDADAVLADPAGRVIIADGRNHLELTDERFDIIVTDPPPPIESSGASVISSKEYYEAGRDHLTEGGVMMQWVPYGASEAETKDHIRTFATVFPEVMLVRGPGQFGFYMMGSASPIALDEAAIRDVLARPGVLEDASLAYDSPAATIDDWVDVIADHAWLSSGDEVRAYAGEGPLVTDDRPLPEYFLLRRLAAAR